MTDKTRILLVEDTVALARQYELYLDGEPYDVQHVETGREALDALAGGAPDVVLLDLGLPDMNGLEILEHVSTHQIPSAVVVITANASLNTAVDAMRLGALDFLAKPFNAERLRVTVRNVIERYKLSQIVETYRKEIDRHEYQGFIGSSLAMQSVYRIIDSAAGSKATVFITGESGTGKEVCAHAIHNQSPRASKPFIALNCGAIPKDLMESEIFGHVKGAFTGAHADRDGAAARAAGGTLFLDEICEMDMNLQTKLLRFIQTGTFQKVGGSKLEPVDIRFICATNRAPMVEVAEGRFREDLFYRLHVIPVHMPALRERGDDVLAIADKLLHDYAAEEGKTLKGFDDMVRAAFRDYEWPGNVRQLQNVIRNIVVLNEGEAVTADMLPAPLDRLVENVEPMPSHSFAAAPAFAARERVVAFPVGGAGGGGCGSLLPSRAEDIRPLQDMERQIIEHAIALCGGNVPKAAARLDISASTIYRKRLGWEKADAS
ncbi:MAG: sigma-54-dependent Fis family transcriptional regulator [Alphaproteobacteria bacterium]|nr:sigma-54-dependent Fis family transcriptional regulator [Alphaproteobacteria bacterium]